MTTAYLDPNLNNALLGGAKSQLSVGVSDRTMAGPVDRVLKVFHHFETNTEQNFWSSNIRYGDATDVRVQTHISLFGLHMGLKSINRTSSPNFISNEHIYGILYQHVGLCFTLKS